MPAKVRPNSPAEEAAIRRGIAADPDNPELGDDFFANARAAAELLPSEIVAALPRRRGPGVTPAKVSISLRLPPEVAAGLRAMGPGWQARAGEALAALTRGVPARRKARS